MMKLMVDDLDAWWAHIEALDLPGRFGVAPPKAPQATVARAIDWLATGR